MDSEIRARVLLVAGLAVLGVTLAGVGTGLGMTSPLTSPGERPQFVISDESVTWSNAGHNVTLVENMSNVRMIQIEKVGSAQFRVQTEAERPLTATERQRARQIARHNRTVQTALASLENYTVTVDPIREITVSAEPTGRYNATTDGSVDTGETFTISNATGDNEDGAVVARREPTYVADRAVVQIRQPSEPQRHELKYSVRVDLANGTVSAITDWEAIRTDSPGADSGGEQNTTTLSASQDGKARA